MLKRVALLIVFLIAPLSSALTPEAARALYDRVAPSLVVIQYTIDAEFGRQELTAQGVVVGEEGLVMTSLSFFPRAIPDEQMKDFKIILPGDAETELDAEFLGRDERSDVAFLKTKETQKWPAIRFEDQPMRVRDMVYAIGLLPKEAGYKPYFSEAYIASVLRGPTPFVLVSPNGVGGTSSPVFNEDGKAIGWVPAQQGQNILLGSELGAGGGGGRGRGGRGGPGGGGGGSMLSGSIDNPSRFFIPARDFLPSLSDVPKGEPLKLPWVGALMTGLNKDVAEVYNLKNVAVAQIGEVIPNTPAAKAGLRPNDKIIKFNGESLERGDEPAEVAQILTRKISRMKVGDKVTLTVLREKDKPAQDVEVTLEERPKQPSVAKRFFAEDLGLAVREMVFEDLYVRRLPASTSGVLVAFVRQASSAASAQLRTGDVIIELNSVPIKDLEQFKTQYQQFRAQKPKDVVVLVIIREGNTQVIRMEPPQ